MKKEEIKEILENRYRLLTKIYNEPSFEKETTSFLLIVGELEMIIELFLILDKI